MSTAIRCTATTKAGVPCRFYAQHGSTLTLCAAHDPDRTALRQRASHGAAATHAIRARGGAVRCRIALDTADARRDYLHRFAHTLLFGLEPAADRAALVGAATKLVDKAREEHVEQLELENAELRKIIGDHVPEARRKLAIVKAPGR